MALIHGAEILVGTMPQGKSHAGSMVPLLEELVRQGHNVTIYMEQYGEAIDFGAGLNRWYINITRHPSPFETGKFTKTIWYRDFDSIMMTVGYYFSSVSCGYVMAEHKAEFERIVSYPWDLVLTDSIAGACGYGIALLSKANHVIMHTSSVEEYHSLIKGFGRQYAIAPPFFMDSWNPDFDARHFIDRLTVIYELLSMWFLYGTVANYWMGGSLTPAVSNFDYSTYCSSAAMSFTDMPLGLYVAEPLNNELFAYGVYCKPFDELHGELAKFVDDPLSNGTILLAFGTMLRFGDAPRDRLEAFVQALNHLKEYRIIWACLKCPKVKTERHVRMLSWVPQTDILNHPKTKLFITHGGLKSFKEAVCAKMPTLFMPVFSEQVRNSWLAKRHGFAQIINRFNVTSNYLLNSIREMLSNPTYKRQAQKMKRSFEDALISPLKEGAFRINRLLKYNGHLPEYFYTRCINFSYIRHLNLDLILIIPSVICMLLMSK